MPVAEQDVLPDVPETKLLSLLIPRALNFVVPDLLYVECCDLDHDPGSRKYLVDLRYRVQVCVYPLPDRRR